MLCTRHYTIRTRRRTMHCFITTLYYIINLYLPKCYSFSRRIKNNAAAQRTLVLELSRSKCTGLSTRRPRLCVSSEFRECKFETFRNCRYVYFRKFMEINCSLLKCIMYPTNNYEFDHIRGAQNIVWIIN